MLFHQRARLLFGAAGVAIIGLASASSGFAATDTETMTIQASVEQSCSLGTANTLDFGIYTPGVEKDAQANFIVNCSLAGTVQVNINDGLNSSVVDTRNMKKNTGEQLMRYNLYSNSGRTNLWISLIDRTVVVGDTTLTVWGKILGQSNQNIPAGSYSDTVTITLTF